ncbi:P-loop containing nucleoside triphosphate hydrolase protein, partial [Mycena leptocephala]
RVAILGSAGIGKTSLALAALHDPRLVLKFPRKYFLSCESVVTVQDMLITMASYLGIVATNRDLKRLILQSLAEGGPCILVLDNFETPWEFSKESRSKIEEFLSLLTEIEQLAVVVTMRGLERPGNVQWTRPFLPPLEPLDDVSARKVFLDIADEPADEDEEAQIAEILAMTDNLPLAINLLANTAAFEGCGSTLAQYRAKKTEILSHGHDKSSNLNKSITLSLYSRRFREVPDAATLLALMSLLPDGISDAEQEICAKHIPNILRCRSTLIRPSMAFVRPDRRLRVLAPIREYMQKLHPPAIGIVMPLTRYMYGLLGL